MPIDALLIELADVTSKIENLQSLLNPDSVAPLAQDERAHANMMLTRLLGERRRIENELRRMAGKPPVGE